VELVSLQVVRYKFVIVLSFLDQFGIPCNVFGIIFSPLIFFPSSPFPDLRGYEKAAAVRRVTEYITIKSHLLLIGVDRTILFDFNLCLASLWNLVNYWIWGSRANQIFVVILAALFNLVIFLSLTEATG
jgi:hypothetical protein